MLDSNMLPDNVKGGVPAAAKVMSALLSHARTLL